MFCCIRKNINILPLLNTFKRNPKLIYSVYLNKGISTSANIHTKYMKRKKISIIILTTIIGYGIYWYFYPHNNYPRSVSHPLRNALWQERKFKDFKTSIRFYIDALEECNKLGMNKTADEYTGIEIKMAEMYEKLNNLAKANEIYLTILNRLYNVLTTKTNTEYSINNTYEQSKWDALIKKDLSLVNKIVTNQNLQNLKSVSIFSQQLDLIETHLSLAESEIYKRNPDLQNIMKNNGDPSLLAKSNISSTKVNEDKKDLQMSINQKRLKHFSQILSTFKEEYIVIRDLYTETFLNKNNIEQAVETKMVTIGWMVLSNMPPGQILLSQANLGSLLYMKAEKIEASILQMKSGTAENYQLINEMEKSRLFIINMATTYFENVIHNAKSALKESSSTQSLNETILQAICLSIHGLGVINLHEGKIPEARRFLTKSINLSKEIGFENLYKESVLEFTKLKRLVGTR